MILTPTLLSNKLGVFCTSLGRGLQEFMMKRILVVDDETDIRQLLEQTLKRDDYEILQAGTGEDALVISREKRPDLILMDILMPGTLDGIEATRILKTDERTNQSKVIVLTSCGTLKELSMIAGADAYLSKPFSPLELLQKIDEFLAESCLNQGEGVEFRSRQIGI
jgi:two-component system, OmpR family, phosphate regulon response regulator PhoB